MADLSDTAAEKKRQALLKEFGLNADLQEAPDPAPAVRALVLVGIVALFVAAMFFPAVTFARPGQPNGVLPTWGLLLTGWALVPAVFLGELWAVGWLANVMLLGVVIELSVQQEKWATMTAGFGVVFAALSMLVDTVQLDNKGPAFQIVAFEPGYFLWQASMLVALVGSAAMWWIDATANEASGVQEAAAW
jgi:hypothetical protein